MLYLYDNAIVDDLQRSFNPKNVPNPKVKVVGPEGIIELAAQVGDDRIHLPLVAVRRSDSYSIDEDRTNFTWMHKGVPALYESDDANIYNEKMIPIKLDYSIQILATNMQDLDEIVREILFKYINQYFLTIVVPYESKRKIRFGVRADGSDIEYISGTVEAIHEGRLFEAHIPLIPEGLVLLHYTPKHIKRLTTEIQVKDQNT